MTKQATSKPRNAYKADDSMLLSEKIGRVRVNVFEKIREDDGTRWYSCPICRWYKDRNGEFRQGGFLEEDLDDVEKAAQLAREVIRKRRFALHDEFQPEPSKKSA